MNWPRCTAVGFAIAVICVVVYDLGLAVAGLLFIGGNSEVPFLVVASDLAGVPFLFYALLTAMPIAMAFTLILIAHWIVLAAINPNRTAMVFLPISATLLQVIGLIFIGTYMFAFDARWLLQERAFFLLAAMLLGAINALMLYGGLSVCVTGRPNAE